MTQPGNPIVVAAVSLALLVFLTWTAARAGLASLLTTHAVISNQIASANLAVSLDSNSPDARYVRATILEASDLPAAIADHSVAVRARPEDYVLWLTLARARELNGETAAAIIAARQAIPLAPDYAQPHYQLGNILLRADQRDEAFKELRLAGTSNPTLMPGIIDLAWRVSNEDPNYVKQVISPTTPLAYVLLGDFFRQQKQYDAAIPMYIAAGDLAATDRQYFVAELIAAKRFKEAAALWSAGRPAALKTGELIDGGFETESNLKEGFGWSVGPSGKGFRLSLDPNERQGGKSSLKVEFEGESEPPSPVISQLVLLEPNGRYELSFFARSQGLVSGGLPFLAVLDANSRNSVAQTESFPKTTDGWQSYRVEFHAKSTTAVQVVLLRQLCNSAACPIFGRLWLDNVVLKKL